MQRTMVEEPLSVFSHLVEHNREKIRGALLLLFRKKEKEHIFTGVQIVLEGSVDVTDADG